MMYPRLPSFKSYQAPYTTILPVEAKKGLLCLHTHLGRLVRIIGPKSSELKFVLEIIQLASSSLSYLPLTNRYLKLFPTMGLEFKHGIKFAKHILNLVKGLRSIHDLLAFTFSWRKLILDTLGLTLLAINILSIIECFNPLMIQGLKISLTAIPIFGSLAWGGIFSFSVIGILGCMIQLTFDKNNQLKEKKRHISQKITSWSHFNLAMVRNRQKKYCNKIVLSERESKHYEKLILEGCRMIDRLPANQVRQQFACQEAIYDLYALCHQSQMTLKQYHEKLSQWIRLEKIKISYKHERQIEQFRKAKQTKWQAKFYKINREKKLNHLSLTSYSLIFLRHAFLIMGAVMGYQSLPLIVTGLLETSSKILGTILFSMKRALRQEKIAGVKFQQYCPLTISEN